jgi:alginate O-acetyltransferase complex protein AlgI
MLTMLLGGLWHGAGWNFVIWGGLHGFALVAQREWERISGRRLPTFLAMPLTFWWVCLAWIFFRAQTFSAAMVIVRSFVAFDSPGATSWGWAPLVVFGALIVAHVIGSTHKVARWSERWPDWLYAIVYGATFACVLAFMNGAVQPFIYFQF